MTDDSTESEMMRATCNDPAGCALGSGSEGGNGGGGGGIEGWHVAMALAGVTLVLLVASMLLSPVAGSGGCGLANDDGACETPAALVPAVFDAVLVRNPSMNPSRVFFHQWHLANPDSGALTFEACAPSGGLVVYLVDNPNNDSISDSRGYAVVFDNQRSPAATFVSGIPGFPTPHPKSRTNHGFKMNADQQACRKYWIAYEHGTVLVGEGDVPGSETARLITCLQKDDNPPTGIQWFGFGALSQETTGIEVKNIRTFDAPPAGCNWGMIVPHQCSSLSPLAKNGGAEMYVVQP